VVFGPEARTRVWLVRDGDRLFADLNATGDLTEPGKCLPVKPHPEGFETVFTPPLLVRDGVPANTRLKVKFFPDQVELYVLNDRVRYVSSDARGLFRFSDKPGSAPIVQLDGPLTLTPDVPYTFARGPRGTRFSATVGTQGLGTGAFAALFHGDVYNTVPRHLVPVADITFPPRVAGGPPLQTRVVLDDRC
jgi:hypothetical protein